MESKVKDALILSTKIDSYINKTQGGHVVQIKRKYVRIFSDYALWLTTFFSQPTGTMKLEDRDPYFKDIATSPEAYWQSMLTQLMAIMAYLR